MGGAQITGAQITGAQIMIVEDDEAIGTELAEVLAGQGYRATHVATGERAFAEAGRLRPDLILLDLGLPDVDGVTLCGRLRAALPRTIIVVLTARTQEFEVVVALDAGADDYLTKPFRLAELIARLGAHLRRSVAPREQRVLSAGRLKLDVAARRAFVGDAEVELRPKEFDLLVCLVERAGEVVSRDELMEEVWDVNWFGSTKTLDVHVSNLRRKLGEHGERPQRISTLRAHGYRYEAGP